MNSHSSGHTKLSITCVIITVALTACLQPIDLQLALQVHDSTCPVIVILEPEEGEVCGNIVAVTGTTSDDSLPGDSAGQISSIQFAVLGTPIEGQVSPAVDGTFSFFFDATSTGELFTLQVTAADWAGNITTALLPLRRAVTNDIPSFCPVPGIERSNAELGAFRARSTIRLVLHHQWAAAVRSVM